MRKWQSLDGIIRSSSSDICPFDFAGAWTNQNKKNMKWLIEKAKPKVKSIIEVWDTYVSTAIKDLLCVSPIGIAYHVPATIIAAMNGTWRLPFTL
jgi:hypothetical protein